MPSHVNQTIVFYTGQDDKGGPAVRVKLDDNATEGRMVVDRVATDEDKKQWKREYAAFLKPAKPVIDSGAFVTAERDALLKRVATLERENQKLSETSRTKAAAAERKRDRLQGEKDAV